MKRLQHFKEIIVTDNIKIGNSLAFGQNEAHVRIDNDGILYFKDTEVTEVSLKFLQTLASSNATSKLVLSNDNFTIGNNIKTFAVDVITGADFTILENGNTGFGTLSPQYKYHFISNTTDATFVIENTVSDSNFKFGAKDTQGNINISGRITSGWQYNIGNNIDNSYITFDT